MGRAEEQSVALEVSDDFMVPPPSQAIANPRSRAHLTGVTGQLNHFPSSSLAEEEARFAEARARMVRVVSEQTGIGERRILNAFERVPRHRFVPRTLHARAYEDSAVPLALEQTVSQPSMVAVMLKALELDPADRVLEVGAGSGYAAALLGELAAEVFGVEILPELARRARQRIEELGIGNVRIYEGNGRVGLPAFAPYDKILVSAGSRDVPEELLRQLRPGGRIAIPVGDALAQQLLVGVKESDGSMRWEPSIPCIFVPLVGKA